MEDQVVVSVVVAAPAEAVFAALTEPSQLEVWWGAEHGVSGLRWEMDARLGGRWRSTGEDESCGAWELSGEVIAFDPPRAIALTWQEHVTYRPAMGPAVVRYDLEPAEGGTRVTVTHSGFAGHPAPLASYREGWPVVLRSLARHFAAVVV
ncbi:MAG: hypothetical protein FJW40_23385 [Acidobacteria bacterium]|nr:hypothetical protein [Acidobacteriota bacterium]